jgi:ketosteroid isomerase-like protein
VPAHKPEELNRLFADGLNGGNLDALVALYESGAALMAQPGQVVTGTQQIREALRGFIGMKPTLTVLESKTLVQAGEIALTAARWRLAGTGPDGHPVNMNGESAEVCRRQADGTWRLVIDEPWGHWWNA